MNTEELISILHSKVEEENSDAQKYFELSKELDSIKHYECAGILKTMAYDELYHEKLLKMVLGKI